MSKYFKFFPKVSYPQGKNNDATDLVTNLIARYAFEPSFKNNTASFYKYEIKESDTPESIAYKFYGASEKHWIVLNYNDIVDPQYDWPLNYQELNKYIDTKYSAPGYADTANTSVPGLEWSKNVNNIKAYYKVITKINHDGSKYIKKVEIDENSYDELLETTTTYVINKQSNQIQIIQNGTVTLNINSQLASNLDICKTETITKEYKTYYDYENELNESKRTIKLLKPEVVYAIEEEFKKKVNNVI